MAGPFEINTFNIRGGIKVTSFGRFDRAAIDDVIQKMRVAVQTYLKEEKTKPVAAMHSFTDVDAGHILNNFDQNKLRQLVDDKFWGDLTDTIRPMRLIDEYTTNKAGTSPAVFRAIKAVLTREILATVLYDIGITTAQFDDLCDYEKKGFYPSELELIFYFAIIRKLGLEDGLNAIIKTGKALGNPSVLGVDVIKQLKSQDLYKNLQSLFFIAQNIHAIKDCYPLLMMEDPNCLTAVALVVKPNKTLIEEIKSKIVNMEMSKRSSSTAKKDKEIQDTTSNINEFFKVMEACLGINAMAGTNKLIRISQGRETLDPASMMTQPMDIEWGEENSRVFSTIFRRTNDLNDINILSDRITYEVNDITDGDRSDVLELDETYYIRTVTMNDHEAVIILKPELFEKESKKGEIIRKTLFLLRANGWNAAAISVLSGPYISSNQITENQYGVIKDVAKRGVAALSAQAKERFKNHYGVSVDRVKDNILGGFQFMEKEDIPYQDLNIYWYSGEGEIVELAREIYVKKVRYKGRDLYILDGFAPELFEYLTKRGGKVVVIQIIKEGENAMPLNKMKERLVGSTNPVTAPPHTLRRWLYDERTSLGLSRVDLGLNGFYLSDNYLEGVRMLNAYFGIPVEDTFAGRLLLRGMTQKLTYVEGAKIGSVELKRLLVNPSIIMHGKEATVFEHTEGMDYKQLIGFVNNTLSNDMGKLVINNSVTIGDKTIPLMISKRDITSIPVHNFYHPKMAGWSRFSQYETQLSFRAKRALGLSGKYHNLQAVLEKIYAYQDKKGLSPLESSYIELAHRMRRDRETTIVWLRNEMLKFLVIGPGIGIMLYGANFSLRFGLIPSIFIGSGLVLGAITMDIMIRREREKTGDSYDALLYIAGKPTEFNKG